MWKRFFLFVILSFALPLFAAGPQPVHAEGGEPCVSPGGTPTFPYTVEMERGVIECITVEAVTATFSNTVPVRVDLHISGQRWQQMDRYPVQIDQWREGNDIYIALYRTIQPSGTAAAAPYSTTVRLQDEFEPGSVQVHVNQYTVEIAIPDAPPPGVDLPPYPPTDSIVRSYATIETVEVLVRPRRQMIHVTGYEFVCDPTLQIDQSRQDNWIFIDVYRLQAASCPARRSILDKYIAIEWSLSSGSYVIQVNGTIATVYIPDPIPEYTREYAFIESVEVLASSDYPTRLTLHVTGETFVSCGDTLHIDQRRTGNRVTVEIYYLRSSVRVCPDRTAHLDEYIPLRGRFEGRPITIQVNDYTLTYPSFPPYEPPYEPPVTPYEDW